MFLLEPLGYVGNNLFHDNHLTHLNSTSVSESPLPGIEWDWQSRVCPTSLLYDSVRSFISYHTRILKNAGIDVHVSQSALLPELMAFSSIA